MGYETGHEKGFSGLLFRKILVLESDLEIIYQYSIFAIIPEVNLDFVVAAYVVWKGRLALYLHPFVGYGDGCFCRGA